MKAPTFSPVRAAATALMALLLLTAPTEAGDGPWRLRLSALSMEPTGSSVFVPASGERIAYDASGSWGLGIELEYRASSRLGIDLGAFTAQPVIDVLIDEIGVISASAKPRITPVFAALNVHLTPDRPVDLFIGPLLAYVVYSSFDLVVDPWFYREGFVTENDLAFGVNAGLDVRLGDDGWLLTAAFRYLETTLEASPPDESIGRTDIDPMIFAIGVGYRF